LISGHATEAAAHAVLMAARAPVQITIATAVRILNAGQELGLRLRRSRGFTHLCSPKLTQAF
jgi:hypothetical protein